MFLVSKSLRFIASIRQMKRRFGGQKEITGKINSESFQTFQNLSSPQTMRKDICRPGLSPDRRWSGWKRVRDGRSTSQWWRVPRTLSAGWNAGCRENGEESVGLWLWHCHLPSRTTTLSNNRWQDWLYSFTGICDSALSQGESNAAWSCVSIIIE